MDVTPSPDLVPLLDCAISAAIGLLVGVERERNPTAKAGVRTFTLIALLGSLCVLLTPAGGAPWPVAAGLLLVGATLIAAYQRDDGEPAAGDSGTTTVIAALAVFALGAVNLLGHRTLAVAAGIALTALLYFKAELEGFSQRLTARDIRSMLQFAALSAVVLPLLPDRPMGPYGVLNPFRLWLLVVVIAGVSLAGYVAWRLTLARKGLLLTGVLGGLVSSTATTLVHARRTRAQPAVAAAGAMVILLANATMLARVLIVVGLVNLPLVPTVAQTLLPALLAALPAIGWQWRAAAATPLEADDDFRNPTQLGTALLFAGGFAVVLVASAWLSRSVGAGGVYALAVVSGLTDVDAITLSSVQLAQGGVVTPVVAATSIALAVGANLLLKAALTWIAGSPALGWHVLLGFGGPLAGLALGVGWLQVAPL